MLPVTLAFLRRAVRFRDLIDEADERFCLAAASPPLDQAVQGWFKHVIWASAAYLSGLTAAAA